MTSREQPVSFWRSWGIAILCWTALGIFQGRLFYLGDRERANYLPFAHYVVWAGIGAYSWAMVTPFVFLFSRHFPFERERWLRRTLQYMLLTVAVIVVQVALQAPAWLYKPDQHQPFVATMLDYGQKQIPGGIQICVFLYFLTAYQNTKREARWRELREAELEMRVSSAELQMLRMQLQPHFLFNALQATTVLIEEDPKAAVTVLQHLGELLRVALDDMRSLQVPLEQEIAFLEHYVAIQKQRFHERLTVRFGVAAETLSVPVPTLLLQPLVENAIHHGIGRNKGQDVVEITARRSGQELVMEVRNFASTLDQGTAGDGHGVGLKNTRTRLEQMYGERASLQLVAMSPRGVSATVTVPVETI